MCWKCDPESHNVGNTKKKKINPYSYKAFYIVKQLARNNKGRVNTLKTGI